MAGDSKGTQENRAQLDAVLARAKARSPTLRLGCIGIEISAYDEQISWTDLRALADFDVVVARPTVQDFGSGQSGFLNFINACVHWNGEFEPFFRAGKTLVAVVSDSTVLNVASDPMNALALIARDLGAVSSLVVSRPRVTPRGQAVFREHQPFLAALKPNVVIWPADGTPLLETNDDTARCLAVELKIDSGRALLVPGMEGDLLRYPEANLTAPHWLTARRNKDLFRAFVASYAKSHTVSEAPDWATADTWRTRMEAESAESITVLQNEIEEREKTIAGLRAAAAQVREKRALLYAKSAELEECVRRTLSGFGLDVTTYDDGHHRIDVVFRVGDTTFVGEVEGKDNKPIDISKFRQLMDMVYGELERQGENAEVRGILFGNPHRLVAPDERSQDFTDQVVTSAARNGVILIKTADLFMAWRAVQDGALKPEEIVQALQDCAGGRLTFRVSE
jgi:hypothetical protein